MISKKDIRKFSIGNTILISVSGIEFIFEGYEPHTDIIYASCLVDGVTRPIVDNHWMQWTIKPMVPPEKFHTQYSVWKYLLQSVNNIVELPEDDEDDVTILYKMNENGKLVERDLDEDDCDWELSRQSFAGTKLGCIVPHIKKSPVRFTDAQGNWVDVLSDKIVKSGNKEDSNVEN